MLNRWQQRRVELCPLEPARALLLRITKGPAYCVHRAVPTREINGTAAGASDGRDERERCRALGSEFDLRHDAHDGVQYGSDATM